MSRLSAITRASAIATALGGTSLSVGAATLLVPDQYPSIQSAVDAAATEGDVVLVSPGTYYENVNVAQKSVDLLSTDGPEVTIVDGQGRGSALSISINDRESDAPRASLKGFTLQHGKAEIGGGVRAAGHVTIENCVVTNNYATYQGGGIAAGSHVVILHDTISRNGSRHSGGGLLLDGVGILVEENLIEDNHAHGGTGAGMSVYGRGTIVSRNIISRNFCQDCEGGGLAVQEAKEVSDNLIVKNRARTGGGLRVLVEGDTKVINNTVADNAASKLGAQLLTGTTSGHLLIANNIFSGFPADRCRGLQGVSLIRNDVYGNDPRGACNYKVLRKTNLKVEPGFVKNAGGKQTYRLDSSSPLIDAGSNEKARGLKKDLAGVPRIIDGGHGLNVDMGAYEYVPD